TPTIVAEQTAAGTRPLTEKLCYPHRAHPDSLTDQLGWILDNWADLLDEDLRAELLRAIDILTEEYRAYFIGRGPAHAPQLRGPGDPNDIFGRAGGRPEDLANIYGWVDGGARFSDDSDWMANLILVAKHTYVWLDQLSKRFGYPITTLDQIPDEALRALSDRGFTGLWLIGLWERSEASREIKRRRGNSEAEASAYALYDYAIADRLGGQNALDALREKATRCGLRLAADMVPNHVGMDGKWVIENPERFLQLPHSPYPGYTFNGPNLSTDDRVGIYLEDGYWTESDAAVVFKRVDHHTGEERFIYHGNDGTQMPWNDTAQLDYLNPDVREIVIQTIVGVAQRFPIIRFDAAMTLARRHIERLWYPAPGHGGTIASRA
ncbi:MAG: alpha-amylase family glycosyl hydrolase, partial [Pseudomonadota bacterium]|nr:alpha-amylase family glycosyl hydrolase [Pseudomonadota bacterium]